MTAASLIFVITMEEYTLTLIKRKKSKFTISFLRPKWWFTCTMLSPLNIQMLCAKFVWKWTRASKQLLETKIFWILLFNFYLPFETGHDPSFEESWIPFTHLWLVPISLVEIGQVFYQKEIFKFPQFIFPYFFIITPWKKGMVLHLNKLTFLSLNYALCHVCLNLTHGSGEEVKNVTSLRTGRQTDGHTDDQHLVIRKIHMSF